MSPYGPAGKPHPVRKRTDSEYSIIVEVRSPAMPKVESSIVDDSLLLFANKVVDDDGGERGSLSDEI